MQARIKNMAWPSTMPDGEWEEVATGIPSKSEPFIAKYVSGREAIISQEKKQRSGTSSPPSFTPLHNSNIPQTTHSVNLFLL
jgi:adenosine deaminase CECR1